MIRFRSASGWVLIVTALTAPGWAASPAPAQVPHPPADPPVFARMKADAAAAIAAATAAGNPSEALDTYDRYYTSTRQHEPSLLALVAKSVLAGVASDRASVSRIDALERLARSGDVRGRRDLEADAGGRNTMMYAGIAADCALARLGDGTATDRLILRLDDESIREKAAMLNSLATAGAKHAASAIAPLLGDENPGNREAAARALATLRSKEQLAQVRQAFESEWHPAMRQTLAMTLHCLGSTAGDALLKELLSSRLPEVRLVAVEAYAATDTPGWAGLARELLRSTSEGVRLRSAVLLGADDAAARKELAAAAGSTNIATREVGSRLLEAAGSKDFTLLVALLRDASPVVRTHAAGALLAAVK